MKSCANVYIHLVTLWFYKFNICVFPHHCIISVFKCVSYKSCCVRCVRCCANLTASRNRVITQHRAQYLHARFLLNVSVIDLRGVAQSCSVDSTASHWRLCDELTHQPTCNTLCITRQLHTHTHTHISGRRCMTQCCACCPRDALR